MPQFKIQNSKFKIPALMLLALALAAGGMSRVEARAENRAGLVVQFSDGSTRQYCFAFPGDSISGLDLLLMTGLPARIEGHGSMGALVCKLGEDGCDYPGEPCVCKSYGPGGVYWTYHHLRDGRWRSSAQGASSYRVRPGEVDGWAWSSGGPPPVFTFEQLCQAEAPAATPTAQQPILSPTSPPPPPPPPPATATLAPTSTAVPRPPPQPPQATSTPRPTQPARTPTPRRSATAVPTRVPTRTPTRTATLAPTITPTRVAEQPLNGTALLLQGAVAALGGDANVE